MGARANGGPQPSRARSSRRSSPASGQAVKRGERHGAVRSRSRPRRQPRHDGARHPRHARAAARGSSCMRSASSASARTSRWPNRPFRQRELPATLRPLHARPHAVAPSRTEGAGRLTDIWIDADVSGRPRGPCDLSSVACSALWPDGRISVLPGTGGGEAGLTIDIRLTVDEDDAKEARSRSSSAARRRRPQRSLVRLVGVGASAPSRHRAQLGPFATLEGGLSSSEGSWQVAMRADSRPRTRGRGHEARDARGSPPGMDPVHYVFPRRS